jgi:2-phosphosulfolactate phosphatase
VEVLAPISDIVIIVDVLSFTTCVNTACSRGAILFPYRWRDESAKAFAKTMNAELSGGRGDPSYRYNLSPLSLANVAAGERIVLPSPNGSMLTLSTGSKRTFAGCLRNSKAVADRVAGMAGSIAVIPAGERWEDHSLRPAIEDLIGAGAIIRHLPGKRSPEARQAVAAFEAAQRDLLGVIYPSSSGREVGERGYGKDVEFSAELDCSDGVPMLVDGAYVNQR